MTKPDLDAIRARLEATTSGEWRVERKEELYAGDEPLLDGGEDSRAMRNGLATYGFFERDEDAEFCAHAKKDIPDLLALVEAQAADLAATRACNEQYLVEIEKNKETMKVQREEIAFLRRG